MSREEKERECVRSRAHTRLKRCFHLNTRANARAREREDNGKLNSREESDSSKEEIHRAIQLSHLRYMCVRSLIPLLVLLTFNRLFPIFMSSFSLKDEGSFRRKVPVCVCAQHTLLSPRNHKRERDEKKMTE